jgi:hypothetical protein
VGSAPYKALLGPEKDDIGPRNIFPGTSIMNNQQGGVARPQCKKKQILIETDYGWGVMAAIVIWFFLGP